jgi:hypothetical protein
MTSPHPHKEGEGQGVGGSGSAVVPGTALPWTYRPEEHDDWGVIRTTVATDDGWYPIVTQARYDGTPTEDDLARHRRQGTDPAAQNARYIVHAANLYPELLAALEKIETNARQMAAGNDGMWRVCADEAASAIARARGEAQ